MVMVYSMDQNLIKILEQKSALQIHVKILEKGGECTTVALLESIDGALTSYYTALNLLIKEKLVNSYQKHRRQKRILSLTKDGEEVAWKLAEIDVILNNIRINKKITTN